MYQDNTSYKYLANIPNTHLLGTSLRQFTEAHLPETKLADIKLRTIRPTDLTAWCEYLQQEQVKAHISWDVKSPSDLQQFIFAVEQGPNGDQIKWAITHSSDYQVEGRLIGTIGFHTIAFAHQSCEIAYDLNPAYWNRGIATQICQQMTTWAHQQLGFKRITAGVMTENQASRRVLEKSGYNLEGVMRSYRKVRGVHRDYLLLSSISS